MEKPKQVTAKWVDFQGVNHEKVLNDDEINQVNQFLKDPENNKKSLKIFDSAKAGELVYQISYTGEKRIEVTFKGSGKVVVLKKDFPFGITIFEMDHQDISDLYQNVIN